jgi:putative aldouronate transport system permease protein
VKSIKKDSIPSSKWNYKANWQLYVMLVPAIIILGIFSYYPMYGVIIAFQDYNPTQGFLGSPFVGLKWFKFLFDMPDFKNIISNTLFIAVGKIFVGTCTSIFFALLLNEVSSKKFKKITQTIIYLPYFLSWVIVGNIFKDLLSTSGVVNDFLGKLGIEEIQFLGSNKWFRPMLILIDTWKSYGWGAILFIAAITNIDPQIYESAVIDGANRFQQARYITLPGIRPTIILVATLSLGSVLNAGFEQVLIMYNPVVYETGDIIDTFVYRTGLISAQFSLATAVGLFKSLVGFILIVTSHKLAYKFANYRIF